MCQHLVILSYVLYTTKNKILQTHNLKKYQTKKSNQKKQHFQYIWLTINYYNTILQWNTELKYSFKKKKMPTLQIQLN